MPHSVPKLAGVLRTVCPSIAAEAIWLAFNVFTFILIAIFQLLTALSVLFKVDKLPTVDVSCKTTGGTSMVVDALSFLLIVNPAAFVIISSGVTPSAFAVLHTVLPLPCVDLFVVPDKLTFAFP